MMFIRKKKYPSGNMGIIVAEKFNGKMKEFLTPVGDSDALAEKLLILLSDKAIRDRHATNCKREADKFRPEVINDQWENYFNGFKE